MRRLLLILFATTVSVYYSENVDSILKTLRNQPTVRDHIDLLFKHSLWNHLPAKAKDSIYDVFLNYRNSKDCNIKAYAWFKLGEYYKETDQPNLGIETYIKTLKIADSCKLDEIKMMSYAGLAYINKKQENFKLAIEYSHVSLRYARILNDSFNLAQGYTYLGNMYKTEKILDSALYYHFKALKIREVENDPRYMALTYNNIGLVYKNMKNWPKALEFLRLSLSLKKSVKDPTTTSSYNNISIVFNDMGNYDSAIYYSLKVINNGIKRKKGNDLKNGLSNLARAYEVKKDYKTAVHYYRRLKEAEDSVGKVEINEQIAELQSKYESDKKDTEIALKSESLKTAEALNSRKNILIGLSALALFLVLIASMLIFRSYKRSKRYAEQLASSNKVVEEKNREITDSINYAKTIQQSLITSEKIFAENLKDYFILYMPKDIVSGDFYWAQKIKNDFIIMCGDCTGHGVPGAFMSLLGISFLKEIVNQQGIIRPDLIFNELRERIIDSFSFTDNKDGMDASLIKINGSNLEVAAANNSIWIVRDKQRLLVKADRFPIGKHIGEKSAFTLNTFTIQPNDLVIQYTDGYADQFGGADGKKHKYKRIEELILNNSERPLGELKNLLHQNFIEWRGNNEQVDDILVIGFRV